MQPQHKETSDDEDDNVPIVSIVMQQKLDVLASVSSSAAKRAKRAKKQSKIPVHEADDGSDCSTQSGPPKKKPRKAPKKQMKIPVPKKVKFTANTGGKKTFTLESVLLSFPDKTEYGITFRAMCTEEQSNEVIRLNKGAATGMKGAMKKNRISVLYKDLVSEKMKEFYILHRSDPKSMFRAAVQPREVQKLQLKFLSIGEWVEVDADRTPGWNSEGGIGVIVSVTDGLADIK
jgi:hypothetical protein